MPNFVTFDDGLTYVAFSDIEAFGLEQKGDNKGGTWVQLRNGHTIHVHWDIEDVAKRLGPVANLHY